MLQACAESKDSNTWKCLKFCRKECMKRGFPKDAESWESSEGFEPSKESKEGIVTRDHRRMSSRGKDERLRFAEENS
jgi:hypothetical protein